MNDKTLYDYWMICYRRRFAIWVMMAAAIAGAILIGISLPPIYEARSMFYVPASATTQRSNTGDNDIPLPASNQDDAKANIGILKGRDALRAIHVQFPQRSIAALQRNVDFTAGRDGIIHVYVRDRDPKLAADIANAFYAYFNRFMLDRMQERYSPRQDALSQRITEVSQQLQDVIQRRNELAALTGTPSLDTETLELVHERENMHKELDELHGSPGTNSTISHGSERVTQEVDPTVAELEKQLALIDVDLAKVRQRTLPNHPDQIALMQSRAAIQASLQQKLASLNAGDKARADTVAGMLKKREQRLKSIPEYQSQLTELDQQYRDLRASMSSLRKTMDEVSMSSSRSSRVGILVETAQPPETAVFPLTWLNVVIATIVSALAGMLYALLLEYIGERANAAATFAIPPPNAISQKVKVTPAMTK